MRRIIHAAALALLVPVTVSANDAFQPLVQVGETLVLVESRGEATALPTYMEISVGVVTTATTASKALSDNNLRMSAVIDALKQSGIKPTRIQTDEFSVEPKYADGKSYREYGDVVGYEVENEIIVRFDDLSRAGEIISLLFDTGANKVSNPSFGVETEKERELGDQSEQDALVNARAQAVNLADALNMRVSRILRISNSEIRFVDKYNGMGRPPIVVTGSRIVGTPIEPGELRIEADLFVEFALVPK